MVLDLQRQLQGPGSRKLEDCEPVVSIDGVGAHDLISRQALLEGLLSGDEILPFVRMFYGSP